ncbi:MAG: M6 family metalloprotease domain-containing protein [Bacteroidaceae bacterium]|nr:M6 family metalloprotease domain-containing protein [Bacteroidaceae bacterium]
MKKKILVLAGLLCSMLGYAQMSGFETDGMPTVQFQRRLCIQHEDEAEGRSVARTAPDQSHACLQAFGSPKIVVCLAQFPDAPYTVAADNESLKQLFGTFFNGNGIGAGENPYSVADYFRAMSNGQFTPEFVITDPVTLSKNRSYYGDANGSSLRSAFRNEALDSLSLRIADRVDELDTNGDGKIDGVIIVFTGCGANVGDENGMHPACWTSAITRGSVTYATALISPELLGMDYTAQGGPNNAKLNGIGVFVHEMSHMLGLPDFYDINYKAPGMDYWSLMDYGEYWHNGYRPTPYTAYERNFMGWLPLVELSEPTFVDNMKAIGDGGSAYVIYNDGNRNEYYVLENRTVNDPWSRSLCTSLGSGLMIYHVDYDASAWGSNRINTNTSRQRMTIIPANGHFELCDNLADDYDKYLSELRGHLWPLKDIESVLAYWGIRGNNALTDEERTDGGRIAPAARLHTPNTDGTYLMHKPITDITFDDAKQTISFSFMGGTSTGIEDPCIGTPLTGDAVLRVYGIDGRLVQTCKESAIHSLPKGMYVLKNLSTGETSKRFVGR